jgi:hypothetical protein
MSSCAVPTLLTPKEVVVKEVHSEEELPDKGSRSIERERKLTSFNG